MPGCAFLWGCGIDNQVTKVFDERPVVGKVREGVRIETSEDQRDYRSVGGRVSKRFKLVNSLAIPRRRLHRRENVSL